MSDFWGRYIIVLLGRHTMTSCAYFSHPCFTHIFCGQSESITRTLPSFTSITIPFSKVNIRSLFKETFSDFPLYSITAKSVLMPFLYTNKDEPIIATITITISTPSAIVKCESSSRLFKQMNSVNFLSAFLTAIILIYAHHRSVITCSFNEQLVASWTVRVMSILQIDISDIHI